MAAGDGNCVVTLLSIQKRRKPDPQRRRVELCDAAIQLLADHGANGLTHRKVDRAAGVPDGTTSFYFRTRLALLRGVAERVAELDLADLRSAVAPNGSTHSSASSELAKVVMRAGTEPWRSRTKARYELMLQASRDPELVDEVGLGAGWMKSEYDQAGIRFDSAADRIARLEESAIVLKGLSGAGPFSFSGRHYSIAGLDGTPKPVQRPIRREGAQLRRIW